MAQTLNEAAPAVMVAEVVRSGEQLQIPTGMTLPQAITLIKQRMEFEDTDVAISDSFDVFPQDGAVAFDNVLQRIYGWAPAIAVPGMFGPTPPQLMTVEIAPGQVRQVPWGRFSLPNIQGFVQCGVDKKGGRFVFSLGAKCKRKDELAVRKLFDEVRKETLTNSIYRGKAIKLRFRDDDGDTIEMPEPKFIDTALIDESQLVYSAEVMSMVRTNLFVPVARARDCLANNIPVKRGVLLGGVYGTGKTMAAAVASKLAVENGITYVYVPRADELQDALEFAKQYQSPACVVFCEDIDRAMAGERSVEMDDILNTLDGVDSKTGNIIVVLTTNHLDQINQAMLRPGRLDAVIEVTPPDADAVQRLLRVYGRGVIEPTENLQAVGKVLAGHIPAVIAEVVKRAKLSQLALQERGTMVTRITAEALLDSARTMASQVKLLASKEAAPPAPTLDTALYAVVHKAVEDHALNG